MEVLPSARTRRLAVAATVAQIGLCVYFVGLTLKLHYNSKQLISSYNEGQSDFSSYEGGKLSHADAKNGTTETTTCQQAKKRDSTDLS